MVKIANKSYYLLFLPLSLLASCNNRNMTANQPQPQLYPTRLLQDTTVVLENSYPATIKGQQDIEIRPRIDGFIENIYIDEGAVVKKGQALFSINSPSATEGLENARANVTSAEAQLNTARINVDRMRPLAENNIISNVQLETYENQYRSAQAALAQANSSLNEARATAGWTVVRSPVDGVVGTLPYRQGSLVSSSNVLTTVANINNVYAYFSVNEKQLLQLLAGLPGTNQQEKISTLPKVRLILADGTQYQEEGAIETISGVIDQATGSATLRAEFPNAGGILRSGMSGRIVIPTTLDNILTVPQKATFTQQDKTLIYKVQGDSVVQKVITVEPAADGYNYAVTDGLEDGDRVVTDGVATLSNGKKIKLQ